MHPSLWTLRRKSNAGNHEAAVGRDLLTVALEMLGHALVPGAGSSSFQALARVFRCAGGARGRRCEIELV